MKIEIHSRKSIEKRANKPFAARTALISITDMDNGFAVLRNKFVSSPVIQCDHRGLDHMGQRTHK